MISDRCGAPKICAVCVSLSGAWPAYLFVWVGFLAAFLNRSHEFSEFLFLLLQARHHRLQIPQLIRSFDFDLLESTVELYSVGGSCA